MDYLRETFNIRSLGLWGRAMGAVTSLLYLHKTIDVKAVVLDSPFKSVNSLVDDVTIVAEAYGGCDRGAMCPSFRIDQ